MGCTWGCARGETPRAGWGQAMLRNLGCILRDDEESLEGFMQENDMVRFMFSEVGSDSIMGNKWWVRLEEARLPARG